MLLTKQIFLIYKNEVKNKQKLSRKYLNKWPICLYFLYPGFSTHLILILIEGDFSDFHCLKISLLAKIAPKQTVVKSWGESPADPRVATKGQGSHNLLNTFE